MLVIRVESPNSAEDTRDCPVVTVDYRRYHQITGLKHNEIVRWYVGAKQAKKSHYSRTQVQERETEENSGAGAPVVRGISLKVSSSRRPSVYFQRVWGNGEGEKRGRRVEGALRRRKEERVDRSLSEPTKTLKTRLPCFIVTLTDHGRQ